MKNIISVDCPICGGTMRIATDNHPNPPSNQEMNDCCPSCFGKYLSDGVALISPDSAEIVILKERYFRKLFPKREIPEGRIFHCNPAMINLLSNGSAARSPSRFDN